MVVSNLISAAYSLQPTQIPPCKCLCFSSICCCDIPISWCFSVCIIYFYWL